MKKIIIWHKPWFATVIPTAIAVLGILILFMGIFGNGEAIIVCVAFWFISIFIAVVFLLIADSVKTEVSYGEGDKIYCKWLFYKWEFDMEQVKSAYYTVSSHYARYSKWYTLDVVFEDKDENVLGHLCHKIESDAIGKIIAGKAEEVELMKLYDYISSAYPEKAVGFKESVEMF